MEQSKVLQKQSTALGRISSGLKVTRAKDNPNAVSQSERLRMQIRGLQIASKNAQDGMSMLQTAEGSLGSINAALSRIKELTVQAGSDTNSPGDKATIKMEIDQMLKSIDDTANNMEFNGVKLLANNNPSVTAISMATGANVGDKVDIPMFDLRAASLTDSNGRKLSDIDVTLTNGADNDLKTIDDVINNVLSMNSKYGAIENRFESTYNNSNELGDKMEAADSSLRDADVAEEMLEYSKDNILIEAGNALLAQTNRFPQDILRVLENIRK
jgi:flagellin